MKNLLILMCVLSIAGAAQARTLQPGEYTVETVKQGNKTVVTKTFADGSKEITTSTPGRKGKSGKGGDPSSYWNFGTPKFDSYGFGQNAVR